MKLTKISPISKHNIISGIISGLIAGVVFGFVLMRMGVLSNSGKLVGMHDPLSGFIVHLVFSAIVGLIFAVVFCKICRTFFSSTLWGIAYSILWWIIGPMTLCPWVAGSSISWSSGKIMHAIPMLVGHLVFGLVLGVSYFWMRSRE